MTNDKCCKNSVLDGMPVVEDANYKALRDKMLNSGEGHLPMTVVSSCPRCGAPIYGLSRVAADQQPPAVKYSCSCGTPRVTINELTITK